MITEPTYRIVAIPAVPRTFNHPDERLHDILKDPPKLRDNGFGVYGVEVKGIKDGCRGSGYPSQTITFLKNGFIELHCPLLNPHFQCRKEDYGYGEKNWLYPYPIIELPLTFILLTTKIYHHFGYLGEFLVQQDYFNIKDFILVPGTPGTHGFEHMYRLTQQIVTFDNMHAEGSEHSVQVTDSAWEATGKLVDELYFSVGIKGEMVPVIRDLLGFWFSFDYQDFVARYRYNENGFVIEILSHMGGKEATYEIEAESEREAIGLGIRQFKDERLGRK